MAATEDELDRMLPVTEREGGAYRYVALNHSARYSSSPRTLARLLELKIVICEQLENMEKPYTLKHVFDTAHWSIAAIGEQRKVCGGLTYRPFPEWGFIELVFLAVRRTTQGTGLGAKLIAQFKQWCRARGYFHILTCADNSAVTFFAKQGFTEAIHLNPHVYQRVIKEYHHVTLMECLLSPLIRDYTKAATLIATQRRLLCRRYRDELARVHHEAAATTPVSDSGAADPPTLPTVPAIFLSPRAGGGDMASAETLERMSADEVLRQMGWTPPTASTVDAIRRTFAPVVAAVMEREESRPFRKPLSTTNPEYHAPADYFAMIRLPLDFGTIAARLERGEYLTERQVLVDLARVCANSLEYGKAFETNVLACRGVLAERLAPLGLSLPTDLVLTFDAA